MNFQSISKQRMVIKFFIYNITTICIRDIVYFIRLLNIGESIL